MDPHHLLVRMSQSRLQRLIPFIWILVCAAIRSVQYKLWWLISLPGEISYNRTSSDVLPSCVLLTDWLPQISVAGISGIFSSHSFRIGTATVAACIGGPDQLIQALGWWSCNAYHLYISFFTVQCQAHQQPQGSLRFSSATFSVFPVIGLCFPFFNYVYLFFFIRHEFYEVEKIIDVHLHRKYHSEEYKVQCKGYGPEDDMWLPRSSFQELVQFQKFWSIPPKMTLRAH